MSLCLRLIILADRLGPGCLNVFLFITKALIRMIAGWSAHTTKSGYIHLQTCGNNFCKVCCVFTVLIKMGGKTFQFSVKKLNERKFHP